MEFPVGAKLLDAMVLSIVSRKETYGYEITHELQKIIDVSESTLYPVLRRLRKMFALRPLIWNIKDATDVIIVLRSKVRISLKNTVKNGMCSKKK